MPENTIDNREVKAAFAEHDRNVTVSNFKVACVLGILLMPAGYVLDSQMYEKHAGDFFKLRCLCSLLIGLFLGILLTRFGRKNYRFLGVTLFMLPASFIAWMIYATEGAPSPYYAGLNLVLLMLAFVLHWTFWESLTASALVTVLYVAACLFHGNIMADKADLINNLYFLLLTAIIVVTGSYFHSRSRFNEFALRFELDRNKQALETSLHQLKENELQLVQSEKLASLGRMSAGIIHEINNPLNFATTGLFTLRKKGKLLPAEQQADYAEIMKDVEDGIKRVQTIVSDLRTFTHPNTEQLDPVKVGDVVTPALRFLSNEWRDRVQIEQNFTADQTIWANKNKLIQVIVNMLQNSLYVLGEKKFPDGEKPTISIEGRVENGRTKLSIRDNGTGIDDKHLGKIFDPFFTTKDVGEGMGLGLSICYKIVQEYGGDISVKTEPGKFCEFTLEFPVKG